MAIVRIGDWKDRINTAAKQRKQDEKKQQKLEYDRQQRNKRVLEEIKKVTRG